MNNYQNRKSNIFPIIIAIIFLVLFLERDNIAYYSAFNEKKDGLEYNGEIRYTNNVNKNVISLKLLPNFSDTGVSHNYYINKNGTGITSSSGETCSLIIDYVANYKNTEHLAQGISNFYKISYEKISLNGRECYHLSYYSRLYKILYLFDYKNRILMVEGEASNNECYSQLDEMAKTISFK